MPSKKRNLEEDEDEEEFKVTGLIDPEGDDEKDAEESDSDAELNKLLAEDQKREEEAEKELNPSDFDSDNFEDADNKSLTDKLSGMKIRTLSTSTMNSVGEVKSKWADGTERVLRPEIDPVYDSDDSDREEYNTLGNIPISVYDEYPHIGYDINGKRIMRPAKGSALDQLLETIDLPEGWTGLLDKNSGKALNLTEEELELIRKIQSHDNPDSSIDPYPETIEWFTSEVEEMPLTDRGEAKRRFVPSAHEAKRIMKLAKAIREGKIVPGQESKTRNEEEELNYDLWDNEEDIGRITYLRAPKIAPPTNEESYNPPEEYLLNEEETKEWKESAPEDRATNFLPQKYAALRKVPGYSESLRERFDRCLDLYLAPRVQKAKLNIDPESLIPDLPSPKDLRPFPIRTSVVYEGHEGRIRTLAVHPSGNWLATGSDDGTVRIWEVMTGREVHRMTLVDEHSDAEDHIEALAWNPQPELCLLAVVAGSNVYLVVPPVFGYKSENRSKLKVEDGWGYAQSGKTKLDVDEGSDDDNEAESSKTDAARWLKPTAKQASQDVCCVIATSRGNTDSAIKKVSWHRRGDYFVTVSPEGGNKASVLVHQLSKHASQSPFTKSKGIIMDAQFHPTKPDLIVLSQRYIRIYNLQQQKLEKKLLPGARWLSCMDIHPRGGDHILAGSFDKRVLWHDLDLSNTPYKTLRFHEKAVRAVAFHKGGLPLFCSCSDDGSIHVFHATVYDDLMNNPLIVPLKKLTGHTVTGSLGVMGACWHPKEAWLFSAGADGTARLWTN